MFRKKVSLAAVLFVFSAACAAPKANQVKVAANDRTPSQGRPGSKIVCHMESDTGSHMLQKVCEPVGANGDVTRREEAQQRLLEIEQQGRQQAKPGN
jgi:hypothetical protein